MKTVDYLVEITDIPEDLIAASSTPKEALYSTYSIYKKAKESNLLWPIWLIDEYNQLWIQVNYISSEHCPEFHTLKLDDGTFITHEFEPYQVLTADD